MPAEASPQLWRVPASVRRLAVAVSVFFVVVALGSTAIGLSTAASVVMWALAFLVGLSIWRWYLVPYVALTDERVVVRGVFARRSVEYDAINGVRPGLYGMRIETKDDGSFIAWAVQKSKFAEWSHRHTRADDVVTAIKDRVERVDRVDRPDPASSPDA
jgi:hypothetical protein